MPLNMVSMAIYVTLEGKIPRTPRWSMRLIVNPDREVVEIAILLHPKMSNRSKWGIGVKKNKSVN